MLKKSEQEVFLEKVEKEESRVMEKLNKLWECKPKMVNPFPMSIHDSYLPYPQPSIRQREIVPEIGVAAFVVEEQIDHRGSDAQIRHNLYVLTVDSEQVELKTEDHGYGREGGAFLKIIEVQSDYLVIETKKGESTITL